MVKFSIRPKSIAASVVLIGFLSALIGTADPTLQYKLIRKETPLYVDFSRDELRAHIGEDQKLLKHFVCDGVREFAVLPELLVKNPKRDSLRFQLYKSEEEMIYRGGHFFLPSGKEVLQTDDLFYPHVESAFRKLEKYPSSRTMLRRLEESPYPLLIRATEWMKFNPRSSDGKAFHGMDMATALLIFQTGRKTTEPRMEFSRIGTGGYIHWDPTSRIERLEDDGRSRVVPSELTLAHEMFHAFDGIRGLLDIRSVVGSTVYEAAEVAEFRAVYFENLVRKESGRRLSKRYMENAAGGNMLDEDSKPIWLPSPCIQSE